MWYSAYPEAGSDQSYGVGYAISHNGVDWEDHPNNPVLSQAVNDDWDTTSMSSIQVVWDTETDEYVLAYQGIRDGATAAQNATGLGFYKSDDGITWKYFQPSREMAMTFSGQLPDGNSFCWPLAFTKNGDNFRGYMAGGPWVQSTQAEPDLWKESKCQIYVYEGPALSNLSVESAPLIEAGPLSYDASGMTGATVVEYEDTTYMFYIGFQYWTESGDGWISASAPNLAYATSKDGRAWTKFENNPIKAFAVEPNRISSVAAQVVGKRIHLWIGDAYPDTDPEAQEGDLIPAVGYFLFEPELSEPHK
jgi:hypothetical protein